MKNTTTRRSVAEAIRRACAHAALEGYEDASVSGLCHEGAWEAAVSAIRRMDLGEFIDDTGEADPSNVSMAPDADVEALTHRLARGFASPGPPAAGSGAAATGALAAGLLEWIAEHAERRGQAQARPRAHEIRRRAAVLEAALSKAAARDAERVRRLIDARGPEAAAEARVGVTESVLEIAGRCSQVATLAAELATYATDAFRPDVLAALRLASSACQCALDLLEANLSSQEDGSEWIRSAKRRAWRVRLLLQRAVPRPAGSGSE